MENEKLSYKGTTYYNLDDIIKAIDIVVGDDGSSICNEVYETLDAGFNHIHYPMILNTVCSMKHKEEDKDEWLGKKNRKNW